MADANRLAAALRYQQNMEGPVTMNPNIAEQGRKGRANMAPPTSVMDPRSRDYERRSKETENFLIGADILAGALPFAPLAKGAAMAAGRYATPKVMQGMENYMGRTGMTLNAAPQDEALRLAQQRAALPVKKGGLGLPADNTPEQRAAAMGFTQDAYHGTPIFDNGIGGNILRFNPNASVEMARRKPSLDTAGSWFSDAPGMSGAGKYEGGGHGAIYPVKINPGNVKETTFENMHRTAMLQGSGKAEPGKWAQPQDVQAYKDWLDSGGIDSLRIKHNPRSESTEFLNQTATVVRNPDNIRSRFAVFDPWRRNSALAAALGVAAPDLLAEEK
jgi:hypothetical protein